MSSTSRARGAITVEFDDWGAINQKEARRLAAGTELALPIRVFFAALARANRIGHAQFGKLTADARDQGVGMDITQHGEEAYTHGEGAVLVLADEVAQPVARHAAVATAGGVA